MSSRVARAGLVAATLACNGGLQPTPAVPGIGGVVTYRGTVPDSTQAVYVVAYHTFPHSRDSLFTFQPPVQSLQQLPLGGVTAPYSIPVESGRYEWVVAVWVKQGFTLANAESTLRETGYYRDPADTTRAGVVNVLSQPVQAIDLVIDFDHMHPPCRYYTPPCP